MESISKVELTSSRLGHMRDGSTLLRAKLHLLSLILSGLNLLLSLMAESKKSTVILAIKELNNVIFTITIYLGFTGIYPLCATIKTQLDRDFVKEILQEKTKKAKMKLNQEIKRILKNSKHVLIALFVMYAFFPLFQTIYILISKDRDGINIQNLPFVFYFHYFSFNSSLLLYFTVLIMHVAMCGATIMLLYCIFNSGFIAVKSLINEIRMTCECLDLINERIACYSAGTYSQTKYDQVGGRSCRMISTNESALRKYMNYLIKQHQCIINDLKVVDKGLQTFILACNNSFGIQICMAIYCAREMDGFLMKLDYTILLIWLIWIMEMYSALGQQVTDEGENLRLALCSCNWLESPAWCRKSFLIMMTRATKNMEIKPYGLISLNLRSFTHVINAAYSYFNLLQNLK